MAPNQIVESAKEIQARMRKVPKNLRSGFHQMAVRNASSAIRFAEKNSAYAVQALEMAKFQADHAEAYADNDVADRIQMAESARGA